LTPKNRDWVSLFMLQTAQHAVNSARHILSGSFLPGLSFGRGFSWAPSKDSTPAGHTRMTGANGGKLCRRPGVCTISVISFDVSYGEIFEEPYETSNAVIPAQAGIQCF